MDIYTMPPKEEKVVMTVEETKKCRIVPQKNRFVPDLLLRNQRIVEETTMEINKAEIARAMSIAEVYLVNEDGSETLLTPFNFCLSVEEKSEGEEVKAAAQSVSSAQKAPIQQSTQSKSTADEEDK